MSLPRPARAYIAAVVAAAAALLALAALHLQPRRLPDVLVLMGLFAFMQLRKIKGDSEEAGITLGTVFTLAALPIVGVWHAVLIAAWAGIAEGTGIKRLFNSAQMVLSAGAAGGIYLATGGPEVLTAHSFPYVMVPVLLADVTQCVVNGLLVAVVISLAQGIPVRNVVEGTMLRSVVSYLAYGLFGLLLAVLWEPAGVGPLAGVLVLLPLFVARWTYLQYVEQQRAYDRTVRALVRAVETKDLYTRGHSERVSKASEMIARSIRMREDRVSALRYAGILHDVGKLGVPTRLLQKTGRLEEHEFATIALHPMRGVEMVHEIEFLGEAFAGILHHHERLDGRGYPSGLRGDQIPEFARIIAVADAFDSMTSTRSYRGARTVDEAVSELQRCAGTQFDPRFVEAMVAAIETHGWTAADAPSQTPDAASPAAAHRYDHAAAYFDHDDPASVGTR